MKIVAIFDFDEYPKTCKECPCHEGEGYFYCPLIHGSHGSLAWYFNGDKERNPYCPLKPIPQKLKLRIQREWITDYDRYEIGYNACLDEIIGKDCRECVHWETCVNGKEGHEKGTSQGYSIGECQYFEKVESSNESNTCD